MCFPFDQIFPDWLQIIMPSRPYIVTAEMASIFPARAHRSCGHVRRRFPRDVRSESLASRPSGEMDSTSFPRERDGVRERDVWSRMAVHHPSGQSEAASIPRERVGVPERELRSASVAAHRFRESTSDCIGSGDHLRAFPQSAPKKHFHRTSRAMQPLPAAVFETIYPNLNINRVCIFRPRG